MTDIVERLIDAAWEVEGEAPEIMREAAAEIKRLRQEIHERDITVPHSTIIGLRADNERLRARLDEATDLLGFAEARLLAFGQHRSSNPDYVLAMDAIKLFLMTEDASLAGAADRDSADSVAEKGKK